MRAVATAWVAVALSTSAFAQTGYFQGLTARPADAFPFPASLTATRSAPAGGNGQLVKSLLPPGVEPAVAPKK